MELLPQGLAKLEPHDEIHQPRIASFEADSDYLDQHARTYLDRIAA